VRYLKRYKRLGIKLVALNGKRPIKKNWQKSKASDKIKSNQNVGVKLAYSNLCCFDIDDLSGFKKKEKTAWKLIKHGIKYSSGKPNRLKILFRVTSPLPTVQFQSNTGQLRCATTQRMTVQDVLPPSLHPEGTTYQWIDSLPTKFNKFPIIPHEIARIFKSFTKKHRGSTKEYLAPYVTGFNNYWLSEKGNISTIISECSGYTPVMIGFRRLGSANRVSIVLYGNNDAFNFSGDVSNMIPYGILDCYKAMVWVEFDGDEEAARKFICNDSDIKPYIDEAYKNENT